MAAPTLVTLANVPGQGDSFIIDPVALGLGLQNGDVLFFAARSQGTAAADITPPTGFQRAGTTGAFSLGDRMLGIWYKPIPTASSEPATYTVTGISGGGNSRIMVEVGVLRGADLAHLNDAGVKYIGVTTEPIPGVTATDVPYTVLAFWGAEFTAGVSVVPSATPSGYTVERIAQTAGGTTPAVVDNSVTTGSRTGVVLVSKKVESGSTTVPDLLTTWAGTPTAIRGASWVVRGLTAAPPIGVPVKLGDGTAARLSYLDGAGVRQAPLRASIWLPGFADVAALLAKPGATMAHRGGSLNWPEMSQAAYDRSVFRGYGMLEFSCGWTSDLVPFGMGDQYLDRYAGVTGSVDSTTMTWATLASTYQNVLRPLAPGVYQPFYRLDDFLDKYTPHHVVSVDPKYGWANIPKITAMLDICDAHGGPDKIVIKFDSPVTGFDLVNAAKARGYTTMNYWGTEGDKLTTAYGTDKWDLIGVRYDADQTTVYDVATAIGKPVWAAVIPDQAGYATAAARGADLMMCSNVAGISPVGAVG